MVSLSLLGEDARLSYSDQSFNKARCLLLRRPWEPTQTIFGSATLIDYMNATADPRADDYFDPNGAGVIAGLQQGSGKLLALTKAMEAGAAKWNR